jgi:Ser/Thr protein kinase RdoA (MazF antagonist)
MATQQERASRREQADAMSISRPRGFPVTRSILSAEALRAEIERAYAVEPQKCQLLCPGSNDTYLLTEADKHYVARVYRARWRTPSEILFELDLLTHLAAKGVSVSVPIAAEDGALMRPLSAPEGVRQLVLFSYVQGTPLSSENGHHCYLAGRAVAQIHAASDDFASRHDRFRLDLARFTLFPLPAIRPFLEHRPKDWSYLEAFAARLRDQAEAVARPGLDWGICHGDFSSKNILLSGDQALTVLDFDHCASGWRVYDFTSMYRFARERKNDEAWQSFLQGYRETRPIAATDLEAVPLFRALRHLLMLGTFAQNADDWGTASIGDAELDNWLNFFREWEAEHLGKR